MAILGSLNAVLSMDTNNFQKGAKEAEETTSKMKKAMSVLKVGAIGAGVAVAGAFAGGIFAGGKAADDIDKMSKMSRQLGISTNALGVLKLASERGGASLDTVANAVVGLSRRSKQFVQTGKGPLKDVMNELGISQADLAPVLGDTTRLLGFFADRLNALPQGVTRTNAATRIFSKTAGVKMLSVLEGGSAGLAQTAKDAKLFGLTLSQSAGQNVEAFNDNMAVAQNAMEGLRNSVVSGLSPAMRTVSEMFADWVRGLAEARGGFANLGKDIAGKIIGGLKSLTIGLATSINKLNLLKEAVANPIDAARGKLNVTDVIDVQKIDETFTRIQRGIAKVAKESSKAGIANLGKGLEKAAASTSSGPVRGEITSGIDRGYAASSLNGRTISISPDSVMSKARRNSAFARDIFGKGGGKGFSSQFSLSEAERMARVLGSKGAGRSSAESDLLAQILHAMNLMVEHSKELSLSNKRGRSFVGVAG